MLEEIENSWRVRLRLRRIPPSLQSVLTCRPIPLKTSYRNILSTYLSVTNGFYPESGIRPYIIPYNKKKREGPVRWSLIAEYVSFKVVT
ncbi:hypothetical protein T10_10313 [Trichinella papuae]|uniref:Uncharacterized protein n=1 Tax=Trichinella papuae TaxID=268474 RepID=A0A0V1M3B3_9BILA|nr:hypothetical protein T10_10313 [Trichinella papuae]